MLLTKLRSGSTNDCTLPSPSRSGLLSVPSTSQLVLAAPPPAAAPPAAARLAQGALQKGDCIPEGERLTASRGVPCCCWPASVASGDSCVARLLLDTMGGA
eukprot:scaffold137558_cov17-Tisochrysis_lutea.AAC.1